MSSAGRDSAASTTGTAWSSDTAYMKGSGWIGLAAIMLGLAGVWNVINGLLAVSSSRVFVDDAVFVFSDLNTWGWIIATLGALQLVAAFVVDSGSELARWFGIVVAGLNALGQLYFMDAKPYWSIAMFAVDILIIYGLVVYGGKQLREV